MLSYTYLGYCKCGNIGASLNLSNLAFRNMSLKLMVRQIVLYNRPKLTTTYKTLILMATNMWSLSKTLNIALNIIAANISGFTVIGNWFIEESLFQNSSCSTIKNQLRYYGEEIRDMACKSICFVSNVVFIYTRNSPRPYIINPRRACVVRVTVLGP